MLWQEIVRFPVIGNGFEYDMQTSDFSRNALEFIDRVTASLVQLQPCQSIFPCFTKYS